MSAQPLCIAPIHTIRVTRSIREKKQTLQIATCHKREWCLAMHSGDSREPLQLLKSLGECNNHLYNVYLVLLPISSIWYTIRQYKLGKKL